MAASAPTTGFLRGVARDRNDRVMAIAVWVGMLIGLAILGPALLLATWSQRSSLTRRHAIVATTVFVVVFPTYVGGVVWAFTGHGGMGLFVPVLVTTLAVWFGVSAIGLHHAIRAPIAS